MKLSKICVLHLDSRLVASMSRISYVSIHCRLSMADLQAAISPEEGL